MITDALKDIPPVDLLAAPISTLMYKMWQGRNLDYRKIDKYMAGDHDLSFATAKFSNAFGNLFREHSKITFPA